VQKKGSAMKAKLLSLDKALRAAGYTTVVLLPGRGDSLNAHLYPGNVLSEGQFAAVAPLKASGLTADISLFQDPRGDILILRNIQDSASPSPASEASKAPRSAAPIPSAPKPPKAKP
jgi:hypothetical protein